MKATGVCQDGGDGEMAQQFRVLGDLAEKFGSQYPHWVVQTAYNSNSKGSEPSSGFCRHPACMCHTETQAYIRDVEVTKASPRLEKLRREAKTETACRWYVAWRGAFGMVRLENH